MSFELNLSESSESLGLKPGELQGRGDALLPLGQTPDWLTMLIGATDGQMILQLGSYMQFRYSDKTSGRFRYDLETNVGVQGIQMKGSNYN